jgi:hypothetical protein
MEVTTTAVADWSEQIKTALGKEWIFIKLGMGRRGSFILGTCRTLGF